MLEPIHTKIEENRPITPALAASAVAFPDIPQPGRFTTHIARSGNFCRKTGRPRVARCAPASGYYGNLAFADAAGMPLIFALRLYSLSRKWLSRRCAKIGTVAANFILVTADASHVQSRKNSAVYFSSAVRFCIAAALKLFHSRQ